MLAELLTMLLTLVISVVFLLETFDFPKIKADPGGAALLPQILCAILIVTSILLILQLAVRRRAAAGRVAEEDDARRGFSKGQRQTLFVSVLSLIYPLGILKAGFIIATFLYLLALYTIFETPLLRRLLLSCLASAAIYFLFGPILGAHIPQGEWVESLLN